jgi:uncharacterized protein YjbI with pentapeptide repeats
MIKIKNTKIFKNGMWRKLPRLIKIMQAEFLDLSYAILSDASLSGANLRNANLRGADLSGANLSYANLSYANLRGADLSYANLRGADLSYANLRGADLSYANLRGANLSGANLRGADLSYANLRGADLSYANLRGANLSGANNINEIKSFYNQNISMAEFDFVVYQQSQIGSENRTITYIPSLDVIWIGCFRGTLTEGLKRIDDNYPPEHKINKEYKAIIEHFQNLELIRKG